MSGFLDWLNSPGTGPLGPYMDAPGAPAGASPSEMFSSIIGASVAPGQAAAAALPNKRTIFLYVGIGIILFTVITSGD